EAVIAVGPRVMHVCKVRRYGLKRNLANHAIALWPRRKPENSECLVIPLAVTKTDSGNVIGLDGAIDESRIPPVIRIVHAPSVSVVPSAFERIGCLREMARDLKILGPAKPLRAEFKVRANALPQGNAGGARRPQ